MISEDVTESAPGLLIDAYRDQPLYGALIAADMAEVQELLEAIRDVRRKAISIADGAGEQLDRVGVIVGEPRWTADDDAYRITLRARVLINRSNGTAPEMIAIAALLGDTDHETGSYVHLTEVDVVGIVIEIVRTPVLSGPEIHKRLCQAKAAGVSLTTIVSPVGEGTAPGGAALFGWSGGATVSATDHGLVWSNTSEPGGFMAWALR